MSTIQHKRKRSSGQTATRCAKKRSGLQQRCGSYIGEYLLDKILCDFSACSDVYLATDTRSENQVVIKVARLRKVKTAGKKTKQLLNDEENIRKQLGLKNECLTFWMRRNRPENILSAIWSRWTLLKTTNLSRM